MSALFLVTGFEPFGEHGRNPSWDALESLRGSWGAEVVTRRLPVHRAVAHELLRRTLDELAPRAVLCTGLAKGGLFRMEHRARRPPELRFEHGPEQASGRWPWAEMSAALATTSVSAVQSEDAGQYVCESTYWSLLTYRRAEYSPEFAAFLHVPSISVEHPLARIAEAVDAVVTARHRAMRAQGPALCGMGEP